MAIRVSKQNYGVSVGPEGLTTTKVNYGVTVGPEGLTTTKINYGVVFDPNGTPPVATRRRQMLIIN